MKNWIKITIASLVLVAFFFGFEVAKENKKPGPEGTNGTYTLSYDVNAWTLRQKWMNLGSINDSTVVRASNTYFRKIAPLSEILSSYATTSSLSTYMTTASGNAAMASMQTDINGKVPNSRVLTINGVPFNLSADRSWTVAATVPAKVFNNNVSRTLNSNYTISATRDVSVSYSVSLSVTNPLLAGASTASAFLEYSTDAGANWITVSQAVNSSSVALTVTVAITQPNTSVISGIIPSNALVRLRSTTAGTASVSYVRGQETYL